MLGAEDFPAAMRAIVSWGAWILLDKGEGRLSKVLTDGNAVLIDKSRMLKGLYRFDQTLTAWNAGLLNPRCKGLGFRFEDAHGLLFVDLDGVRDPRTGELHPRAAALVAAFPTWCEVSQSGRGLHLVYRRSGAWRYGNRVADEIKIEAYAGARFAALTGNRLAGTADDACALDVTVFAAFCGFGKVAIAASDCPDLPPGLVPGTELVRVVRGIWPGVDRNQWISVIFGLRHASGGSADGLGVALAWSAGAYSQSGLPGNHDASADPRTIAGIWRTGEQRRNGPRATAATLYRKAGMAMPEVLANLFRPPLPDFGHSPIAVDWDVVAAGLAAIDAGAGDAERPSFTQPEVPPPKPPDTARYRMAAQMAARATAGGQTTLLPWFMSDSAGMLALTEAVLAERKRVTAAVPSYEAAEQLDGVLRAAGVGSMVLYSRATPGMCKRAQTVITASRLGLEGIGNAFCIDGVRRCPHMPDCPLVANWRSLIDADVVIVPAQRLTSPLGLLEGNAWKAAALGERPIVTLLDGKTIVDGAIEHGSLGADDLDKAVQLAIGESYRAVMRAAHVALAANQRPVLAAIRAALPPPLADILDRAEVDAQAKNIFGINPGDSDAVQAEAIANARLPKNFAATMLLIRALRGNPGQVDLTGNRIQFAVRRKALKKAGRLGEQRIVTYGIDDPALARRAEQWLRQSVSTPERLATGPVGDAPVMFQLIEREMTLAAWREGDHLGQRAITSLLMAMQRRYGNTGLVAHREVVNYTEWRPAMPFDADRLLGNIKAVLIGGRHRPGNGNLYRAAACFDPGMPALDSSEGDNDLIEIERRITDRQGQVHHCKVWRHPQTAVTEEIDLVEQTTQARTLDQIVFDGPRHEAIVVVMSSTPVPGYPPDRVVTMNELFGQERKPLRLPGLLERLEGVVPLHSGMLQAYGFDALPGERIAKRFIEAIRKGPLAVNHPSWLYRRVEIEVAGSRDRKIKPIEAVTCLADLEEARSILRRHLENWLDDPQLKYLRDHLATWGGYID